MRTFKKIFFIFLVTSLGIGVAFLLRSPIVRLQSVEVLLDPSSRESLLFEKIQNGLSASLIKFNGMPFWKVGLDDIMAEVRKDQRVRVARIQRDFPHHVRVIVVPHEPLLGLMDERGRISPVARDGTLLPAISLKDSPNFPLLRGREFQKDLDMRLKALTLLEAIPTEGRFRRGMISEILHSRKYGFEVFLSDQSAEVKMGEGEFELKAARVEKVLSYLHNRNMEGRMIDARFGKKVVVRLRNNRHPEAKPKDLPLRMMR